MPRFLRTLLNRAATVVRTGSSSRPDTSKFATCRFLFACDRGKWWGAPVLERSGVAWRKAPGSFVSVRTIPTLLRPRTGALEAFTEALRISRFCHVGPALKYSVVTIVLWIVLGLVLAKCAAQLWLDHLNRRHVLAHAGFVPPAFKDIIDEPTYAK